VLDVWAVDPFNVFLIEDGLHRLNGGERVLEAIEHRRFENLRLYGGFVGVVLIDIPAAEDQIVQSGQGYEILDSRGSGIRTLAQADGGELRERAYGFRQ